MNTHAIPSMDQKLSTATQDFIRQRLPDWLTRASTTQLATLRGLFKVHRASQRRLRAHTGQLLPLQVFAERHLLALLEQPLPQGVRFADLEWRVVTPRFDTAANLALPTYGYGETRRNGLLQLMSNFPPEASYYLGSGLVAPGTDEVLSGAPDTLVQACRERDVGAKYQAELDKAFTPGAVGDLADDKRAGFKLACKIAALRGDISAFEELALREVADDDDDKLASGLRGYPGLLQVLGQPIADGLLITLKDDAGAPQSLVLYLPGDPRQALRRFDSAEAMHKALAEALDAAGYRQYFSQLVSLEQRARFVQHLDVRLKDASPDLQVQGRVPEGGLFAAMASEQVQRVKDDARLLLVPTAQANAAAARARLQAWEAAGMGVLNLAGFFIPVVGAMLLGQLLAQTLSDVYEGVMDLSEGHQHEALEHLFDVLETVVSTAAVVGAGAVLHNAVVAAMEPVTLPGKGQRLWSGDLVPYESYPETPALGSDGLYALGARKWLRSGSRYFEVYRPDPEGPYRVRHPLRNDAFGPEVVHNGERSWRLLCEQPRYWHDSQLMLDTLWPQHPAVGAERARQILQVAGVDQDELRGILMENRRAPVNLRETLRRFEQDGRVERFFTHVRAGQLPAEDIALLQWCEAQPFVGTGLANVLASATALRGPLFEHLTRLAPREDGLLALLRRDFKALPEAYAREALGDVDEATRRQAVDSQKLPLVIATRAASLLRVARLNLALEGLYLSNAYSDDTGALVLALLAQQAPSSVNLELREGSVAGRLIGSVVASDSTAPVTVLVRDQGRFWRFDGQGHPQALAAERARDLFTAIVDTLSAEQLADLAITGNDPVGQLRSWVLAQLPASSEGIAQLLGWAAQPEWFNPGRRLEDGRVGYVLSGRPQGRRTPGVLLREAMHRYFPGLTDAQVERELAQRLGERARAYQVLADLEDDHEQLHRALNRWAGSELNDARRDTRLRACQDIARAWRVQGEPVVDGQGQAAGQRLRLVGLNVSSLPELPTAITFRHLSVLVLNETGLMHIPAQFLQAFGALRELNMNNNRLLHIPQGIGYLTELRELSLRHNDIRPDAAALAQLHSLARLTHLDLSHNPLGQYPMSFNGLPHLVRLGLRNCRLSTWPKGIGLCGFLEEADLRNNQLADVPQEVRLMPYEFRRSLLVANNPLRSSDLMALQALDTIVEEHLPEPRVGQDPEATRSWWLGNPAHDQQARTEAWSRLALETWGDDLIELLERLMPLAGFAWPQAYMAEQFWALLPAMQTDEALRGRVVQLAGQRPTDENAVMDCFSQMLVQRLRNQPGPPANAGPGGAGEASLFALGRSLFRLEQVERIARQDVAARHQRRELIDAPGIRLGYRVRLRQWLGLPGQPHAMRVTDLNRISSEQLLAARRTVRQAESAEALAAYLEQRPFWQALIARNFSADLATIEQVYEQGWQALLAQRSALGEALFQARRVELEGQRANGKRALSLRFMRALERRAG
ncbi:hypothetical protein F3J45_21275 [Pantoea sp. Ap-967]|uniref:NEL-type E3 ubiquitin ligase domain-containing protein n=1 Tax=Pantoea sp. Ap-967 TaxID=2608362 RepID=UPI0014239C17|nr:NEL-type E3 ubiquitin ligase domain-containing protein [Pantoea sp. Ap-967]NIE76974.1 hypothetical protein [Pantoea sp. Ap-967]